MTLSEIARELGISIATAFRDEQRALEKLREALGDATSVRHALLIVFSDDSDQIARKISARTPHDQEAPRVAPSPHSPNADGDRIRRAEHLLPPRFRRRPHDD